MKHSVRGIWIKDSEERTVCEKEQWKDVGSRSDLSCHYGELKKGKWCVIAKKCSLIFIFLAETNFECVEIVN